MGFEIDGLVERVVVRRYAQDGVFPAWFIKACDGKVPPRIAERAKREWVIAEARRKNAELADNG